MHLAEAVFAVAHFSAAAFSSAAFFSDAAFSTATLTHSASPAFAAIHSDVVGVLSATHFSADVLNAAQSGASAAFFASS